MLRRLYLHAGLATFGGPFSFEVETPADMVQALAAQHSEFDDRVRAGAFHLIAGPLKAPRVISGQSVYEPCDAHNYHLYPAVAGANKGRGKMVMGLTLLGLSFMPGVSSGLHEFGTAATGSSQFGQSFSLLGRQILSRTGQYLMAQGALSAISPPVFQPVDQPQTSLTTPTEPQLEGITIPLVYGEVRLEQPLYIETGLQIETTSLT